MPSHQDRREPLPKGYQFGDAGRFFDEEAQIRLFTARYVTPAFQDLADRVKSGSLHGYDIEFLRSMGWNVIEGEQR